MFLTRSAAPSLFFFTRSSSSEIYTLSLHDALPIFRPAVLLLGVAPAARRDDVLPAVLAAPRSRDDVVQVRSEEHTSELQSHSDLVCRLLLEKKNGVMAATYRYWWTRTSASCAATAS